MPIEINRVECIDTQEIMELLDLNFSTISSFHSERFRQKLRGNPFPEPDFVINQKFFWKTTRIHDIITWRNARISGNAGE